FLGRQHPTVATTIRGRLGIPVLGAVFSIVLILLVNPVQTAISIALLAVGIPVYAFFSPKQELQGLKAVFFSPEAIREPDRQQAMAFLAFGLRVVRRGHSRTGAAPTRGIHTDVAFHDDANWKSFRRQFASAP